MIKKEKERSLRKLFEEIFEGQIKEHKPTFREVYLGGLWGRAVGPSEIDPKIYLGLVDCPYRMILEIWESNDERMYQDKQDFDIPKISLDYLHYQNAVLIFDVPYVSSQDIWLPLLVHLQNSLWKGYDKIMSEKS